MEFDVRITRVVHDLVSATARVDAASEADAHAKARQLLEDGALDALTFEYSYPHEQASEPAIAFVQAVTW